MDNGISISELGSTPEPTKPKKDRGLALSELTAKPDAKAKPSVPAEKPTGLVSKIAADTKAFLTDPATKPLSIVTGVAKSFAEGGKWMAEKAAEGIAGIATSSKYGGYNQEGANAVAKQVHSALEFINTAPTDKTEEAVTHFMSLLGEVPHLAGETVFDKTGSALAATGAETLTTLLLLRPGIVGKVFSRVPEGPTKAPISSAFDTLAAKDPEAASGLADHVGQVDPKTAKYMKNRIQKFTDASDKELSIVGKNAAEAAIKELEASYEDIVKTGTVKKAADQPQRLSPEQVSSTIRTAAKEGTEAIEKHPDYDIVNKFARESADDGSVVAIQGEPRMGDLKVDHPPDIVYFSSGVPVTRQAVEAAFKFTGEMVSKIPGVEIAKGKMERLYRGYIETFNPEAKGPAARTAGSAIAQNFFERAHREHVTWEQGKERRTYWQKMGEQSSMEFIHGSEKGKAFANPVWEKARQGYRNWAAEIYKQDMKTGFTYDPVDHYMPHLFKDGEGVTRFMQKRYGNKWADPRFIKERGYDLYQEAMDAGFTPRFTNPEEIMQARQQASDIAALRTDLLADLERKGVAQRAAKGADRPPAGFSPNSRRSPTGQRYWIRDEADPLMHNAFDSKSLWSDRGLKGEAFRGFMELKNKIIPIKLGASLFHPMHVLHIDASAELARASKLVLGAPSLGHVKDFMLSASTAYLKPLYTNPKAGYPLLKVFQGKRDFSTLSEADKAAFKDLAESGMVPTRPMEETSGSVQKFKDALNKHSVAAAWHLPWAALSSISHPLFNVWIPSLKVASVLKDIKVARELNPEWTSIQRQEAFRQIARKVEARYGEMNYNSLFMDKTLKDIGVATNLSLGWNIGLLDQYVGGAIDLGRAVGERGSLGEKLASGRLDRPVFAAYYISTALMIGGTMHYMFTGKQPEQLIDYTHPESGEKDQYGKPVRLNTMFYTREFEGLYKHMEQEGVVPGLADFVTNKGSGLMEMSKAAITGVNSLGQEIRDPNAPAYKQFEQTLLNTLGDLEPISVEAIKRSTGSTEKMGALSVLGFTQAGKYISETVLEGQITNDFNKYVRPKEKPFQAVEMSKDTKELREMYNKDDPAYDEKLEAVAKKYDMDDKDIRKLEKMFSSPKEQDFDPSIWMFSKLPWEVQKPLLDKMSQEERENYLQHISKQKRRKYVRETE